MAETIGCCGHYRDCAAQGVCVRKDWLSQDNIICLYRGNLEAGYNFYNPVFKAGPYLEHNGRQYMIRRVAGDGRLSPTDTMLLQEAGLTLAPFDLRKADYGSGRPGEAGMELELDIRGAQFRITRVSGSLLPHSEAQALTTAIGRQDHEDAHTREVPMNTEQAHPTPSEAAAVVVETKQVSLFDLFEGV